MNITTASWRNSEPLRFYLGHCLNGFGLKCRQHQLLVGLHQLRSARFAVITLYLRQLAARSDDVGAYLIRLPPEQRQLARRRGYVRRVGMGVHAGAPAVESSVIVVTDDTSIGSLRAARPPAQQSFTARYHFANLNAFGIDGEQAQFV